MNNDLPTSRTVLALKWAALLAVVTAMTFGRTRVVIPTTPSTRYHLLLESNVVPHKGDYVNVEIYDTRIERDQPVTLTKRIACEAGDRLTFAEGRHFCNGKYLGSVLERTSQGVALRAFKFDGPIPAGKVFLIGDHERSFDSRYFGLVNARALRRLIPVL